MPDPAALWRDFSTVFPIIVTIEASRYVITAALASLIVWLFWSAWFKARKIQTRAAGAADYTREIFASLRTALIFAMTGYSMHLASGAGWLTIYDDFSVRGPGYFAATLVLMILAQDAYFYWTHRAMHHPRLFRLFHRTHHKSKTPTPWTAYAFDASEAIVMVAFVPLWAKLVPMHEAAIFAFVTWQIVRNVMGHAGVEMFPVSGRPSRLFGWFNTTTHHDLHHQHGRYNFGLYFSWWDRVMGTEHPECQARVAEIAARSKSARTDGLSTMETAAVFVAAAAFALTVTTGETRAEPAQEVFDDWATEGFGSVVRLKGGADPFCKGEVWRRLTTVPRR